MLKNLNKMVVMLAFTSLIVSCKDDPTDPQPFEAKVSVVQVLNDVEKVDFHVGDEKVNTAGIAKGVFDKYYIVLAGNQKITVFEEGQTDTLVSVQENLAPTSTNTLFVYGNEEDAKWLSVRDNMTEPQTDKAKVRVVNTLENEANAHLFIEGLEDAWIENAEPKKVQNFVSLSPVADKKLSVTLGDSEIVVAEIETLKVEAGKIYSIILFEEIEGETTSIKAKLIEQK